MGAARGEILATGYMSDGTTDIGVWANGEGTSLEEMVGAETMAEYDYQWTVHGLSDQGTLAATVRRLSDNTQRILLLVPVEVDCITRDTDTGEISSLGSEIAEALPVPEIDLAITEAEIEGTNLNITVTCKVRDPLSELPEVLPVDQLKLFINGDLVENITNLSSTATGSPVPVWQARSSEVEIQRNFTIPVSGGIQTVSAQTSDNAAGNHGYAAAYVVIGNHMPPEQPVAASLRPKISLPASLSSSTTDTLTVQFPGEVQATLTETDQATSYFVGTAVISSVAQQVKIRIKSSVSLDATTNESFGAAVAIGAASAASYEGWWQETGVSTQEFACSEFYHSGNAPELLYVDSIKQSGLGEIGFVQPFVTRLTASPTFKALISEGGPLKLTLNGEEVPLVEKPAFIPDDDHPDHVYIGQDSHPRLFTAHEALEGGTLAPEGTVTQQEFKVELRKRDDDSVVWNQDQTVIRSQPSFQHMEAGGIVEETPPAIDPSTLTQAEFDEQMMIYYAVLFGDYGTRLHTAGVELNFTFSYGSLPWSFVKWDVDNYLQGAYNEGKRAHITLDREGLKTPAKAAQALFAALRHLFHSYYSAIEIQQKTPPEEPSPLLSAEDAAIYQELSQGRYGRIAEAMGDVSLAVEMGISIASPITGVLLSVSHISDAFRDGQDASAYAQSALLLLPLAAKFAVRAGKPLTVRLGRFVDGLDFVIPPTASRELITALQTIGSGKRVNAMRQLRPLIESGEVTADWIELWYKAGWLKFPVKKKGVVLAEGVAKGDSYEILVKGIMQREGLAVKPANTRTHHDFPFQTGGTSEGLPNLQLAFLKRGIDPDDGLLSGRFLDTRFHNEVIHGGKEVFGPGGAWNYQWEEFFRRNIDADGSDIFDFLEELTLRTSDDTVTSWQQIDWFYKP